MAVSRQKQMGTMHEHRSSGVGGKAGGLHASRSCAAFGANQHSMKGRKECAGSGSLGALFGAVR
eukprot:1140738-Pelagomonas_calceolata.AAC.4